jgi:uncharacterized protein
MSKLKPVLLLALCGLLVFIGLLALVPNAESAATSIPAFTPNVVDTTGTLGPADIADINSALQQVRDKAGLWGAVYIVSSLQREAIESLSERAFRTWELGKKGQDNGLLLVLAMQDRRSRFEVGYGLEGDLPDLIARQALDDVLTPLMRQGEVKSAIIESFNFMAGVKSHDPVLIRSAPPTPSTPPTPALAQDTSSFFTEESSISTDAERVSQGWIAFAIYATFLWGASLLIPFAQRARARRLAASDPRYVLEQDASLNYGQPFSGKGLLKRVFLTGFFTLNPGLFVFVAGWMGMFGSAGLWLIAALCALVCRWCYRWCVGRYTSMPAYTQWQQAKSVSSSASGSSWSRSSSSSSHSSSSSSRSGGGRSGGGGSSGSW